MQSVQDESHAGSLPLSRWLRMCSRMAAKLMNSSEESSIGSAVYFSNSVFTENLEKREGTLLKQRERVTVVWLFGISTRRKEMTQ